MPDATVINFKEKMKLLTRCWSPGIVARVNDAHFKLVKFKGEFVWHRHCGMDEAFIVLHGERCWSSPKASSTGPERKKSVMLLCWKRPEPSIPEMPEESVRSVTLNGFESESGCGVV